MKLAAPAAVSPRRASPSRGGALAIASCSARSTARSPTAGRRAGRPGAGRPARGPGRPRPSGRRRRGRPGDKAHGEARRRRPAAGEQQVHGPGMADQRGSRIVARSISGTPKRRLKTPRIALGRHPQVAPEGQLEASGHRRALDRGQHRLGQPQPGRPHRPSPSPATRGGRRAAHRLRSAPVMKAAAPAGQHVNRGYRAAVEALRSRRARRRSVRRRRRAALGRVDVTTVTGPSRTTRTPLSSATAASSVRLRGS